MVCGHGKQSGPLGRRTLAPGQRFGQLVDVGLGCVLCAPERADLLYQRGGIDGQPERTRRNRDDRPVLLVRALGDRIKTADRANLVEVGAFVRQLDPTIRRNNLFLQKRNSAVSPDTDLN